MTDYLNPDKLYPDDISRRIDTPPGFDSVRTPVKNQRGSADKTNEYFSVDENGIHIKAGRPSGVNGGAYTVVIDDRTSHITICGGAGEQVKSIVKALRGLADALATLTE